MTTAIGNDNNANSHTDAPEPLLEVEDLRITFESSTGVVEAVRDFDLTIYPGQKVAIVGESGSGKSTSAMAVLGLLPGTGKVTQGSIKLRGEELTGFDEKGWQKVEATGSAWYRRIRCRT